MKRGAVLGLIVLLSGIAFGAGFFVNHHLHRDQGKKVEDPELALLRSELQRAQADVAAFATESRPRLWVDDNAAKVIRSLGYEYVWLLRWQGGVVDGWVEFDEPDGPKRFPLDASRQTFDAWKKEGLK